MFLHNREELQALRQKAEAELHRQKIRVLICAGTGCIASGSKEIYEKMHNLAEINENVSVEFEGEVPHPEVKMQTTGRKRQWMEILQHPLPVGQVRNVHHRKAIHTG